MFRKKHIFRFFTLLSMLSVLLIIRPVSSMETDLKPTEVRVGIFPYTLRDFNFSDRTYRISVDFWTMTKKPNYDPIVSWVYDNSLNFKITNNWSEKRGDLYYQNFRYEGVNFHYWDVRYFPFDRQKIEFYIEEDQDNITQTILTSHYQNKNVANTLKIKGWDVLSVDLIPTVAAYDTTFGLPKSYKEKYSKLSLTMYVKRHGVHLFFSFFSGFFISAILAMFIFFIRSHLNSTRIGFSLSAFVMMIGNKYITDSKIPISDSLTLSDKIQLITFLLILTAVFTIMYTSTLAKKASSIYADKVSRQIGYIAIPTWFALLAIVVIESILS